MQTLTILYLVGTYLYFIWWVYTPCSVPFLSLGGRTIFALHRSDAAGEFGNRFSMHIGFASREIVVVMRKGVGGIVSGSGD